MAKYSDVAKELGIDPAQGVEEYLQEVGELIIGGRLVTAEAKQTKRTDLPVLGAEEIDERAGE